MPSAFWLAKIRTHFRCLDLDGDGAVTENDFIELGNRFIKFGGFSDTDAQVLRQDLNTYWNKYWLTSDANQDGKVTEDEFIETMTDAFSDPNANDGMSGPLSMFYKAIDADNSGDISPLEFETFYECIGIDTEYAEEVFMAIDADNDGVLSQEEFMSFGKEFFLSEDENLPSRFFWGPLIIY